MTLIASFPVQASEASAGEPRLLVHPSHVPSDGTPFSVRVGIHGEPSTEHEVKLWVGSRHRQASQTWTGETWLRADRYAVEAVTDANGSWTGWVHGRVNVEGAGYPDLVEGRERARISLRVRDVDGEVLGTASRSVDLLRGNGLEHRVVRVPGNASLAGVRDPAGGWLAVAPAEPDGLPDGDPPLRGWVELPVPRGWRGPVLPLSRDGSAGTPVAVPSPPGLEVVEAVARGYASPEPLESVTLRNPTRRPVDLAGVCLAAAGRACFLSGTLDPGARVTVARDAVAWRNATGHAAVDLDALWVAPGGFGLPDEGGAVRLRHLARPVDALELAEPPPFPGEVREAGWAPGERRVRVGQSRLDPVELTVNGTAWPALAPQGSYAVMREVLRGAERSVRGSVYLLTSASIARDLADALDRGVQVELLVDGSPVGGVPEEEARILEGLVERGAEVHVLRSGEGFRRRYDALHAKTLVVDGEVVVVGSENWATSSHPPGGVRGNRGWVLAVEDRRLARAVERVLRLDGNASRPDVHPVQGVGGGSLPPRPLARAPPSVEPVALRNASVRVVVAPDTALPAVMELLEGAERSVAVELLSLDASWRGGWGPLVTGLVDAAHRGVHVRVLLDGTYTDPATGAPRNAPARDLLRDVARRGDLPLEARILEGDAFLKVHSKGLVVDGERVLVGSMNWGPAGFLRNREMGLVVEDPHVAGVYQRSFDALWWGGAEDAWSVDASAVPVPGPGTALALAGSVVAVRLTRSRGGG